ncbi:MAG: hypothetical protein ACQERD_00965 [Campylobacterota bacterium]
MADCETSLNNISSKSNSIKTNTDKLTNIENQNRDIIALLSSLLYALTGQEYSKISQ